MSEQNRDESTSGENDIFTNSPLATRQKGLRRKRCAQCGRPFGLIRRSSAGMQFCSVLCMDKQAEDMRKAVQAKANWYKFLHQRR